MCNVINLSVSITRYPPRVGWKTTYKRVNCGGSGLSSLLTGCGFCIKVTLDNVFRWSGLLPGLGFVTVRHWTWLSAPWFGRLRLWVWTARRSGYKQALAWGDRGGDLVRAESQPRPRAAETVVSGQRRGCRTGGESWSNCSWCCHVAVWIGEQSSKGWQRDSLYGKIK